MKTIAELKAENIPSATFGSLFAFKEGEDPDVVAKVSTSANEYLKAFLTPQEEGKCVQCGTVQGGLVASLMGTGFRYGIVFGEGACGTCGYPGRTHHDIEGVGTVSNLLLQYHPSGLEETKAQPADEEMEGGSR